MPVRGDRKDSIIEGQCSCGGNHEPENYIVSVDIDGEVIGMRCRKCKRAWEDVKKGGRKGSGFYVGRQEE